MASSSSEWLCDTDSLLGEWLSLHPDVLKPDKIDAIGSGDGIVIVDMQKDFIPVDPLFGTTRGHFGIHEDVSLDGTAGCIGLAGRALTEEVTKWVNQVGARYLVVLN